MYQEGIIRVVWICQMSSPELRSHLDLHLPIWHKIIRRIMHRDTSDAVGDIAIWNINAVKEFQLIDDIELHVIFVHEKMCERVQQFKEGRIMFYAVGEGETSLFSYLQKHFMGTNKTNMSSRIISSIVEKIQPNIIHVMGAENPQYSLSVLALPSNIPIIVQLQTLLHKTDTKGKDVLQRDSELQVLCRADYIGTKIERYKDIILSDIKPKAKFVQTRLMIAEKAKPLVSEKHFDFVYFANHINKSVDLAIEAFCLAYQHHPEITLDIVGGTTDNEIAKIRRRLEKSGCNKAVSFEGRLQTHEDVIIQISKARFALLPLKIDFISGTLREAMWYGLPVVTTITSGTPLLNEVRDSVLLSRIGDHEEMAKNMCKLIENPLLADKLQKNAFITLEEMYEGNDKIAAEWVNAYKFCIEDFKSNISI